MNIELEPEVEAVLPERVRQEGELHVGRFVSETIRRRLAVERVKELYEEAEASGPWQRGTAADFVAEVRAELHAEHPDAAENA